MNSKNFFGHDLQPRGALELARSLIGALLVKEEAAGVLVGRIVETEAYLQSGDPASHSRMGKTKRNMPMFGLEGSAYIYQIYGVHYCFNVVSGPEGEGEAVLIRAVEPLDGIDIMRMRRTVDDPKRLTNGPAKICQAFELSLEDNGRMLQAGFLRITHGTAAPTKIGTSSRVGISKGQDLTLRFFEEGSPFLSRSLPSARPQNRALGPESAGETSDSAFVSHRSQ